jgi:hypothetical protein
VNLLQERVVTASKKSMGRSQRTKNKPGEGQVNRKRSTTIYKGKTPHEEGNGEATSRINGELDS